MRARIDAGVGFIKRRIKFNPQALEPSKDVSTRTNHRRDEVRVAQTAAALIGVAKKMLRRIGSAKTLLPFRVNGIEHAGTHHHVAASKCCFFEHDHTNRSRFLSGDCCRKSRCPSPDDRHAAAFSITRFRLRSLHCGGKREGGSKRRQQPRRSNELPAGNRHDEPPALSVSARSPAISNALAIATADRTPSFLAALPRWSLTVGNEIDSRSAICLLSSP